MTRLTRRITPDPGQRPVKRIEGTKEVSVELQVKDIEIRESAKDADAVPVGAERATGAAVQAGDAAADRVRTGPRRFQLQGAARPVNRLIADMVRGAAAGALEALQPERAATAALRLVQSRALRHDLLGDIAYRGLGTVNRSLNDVSRMVARLEKASQPPPRGAARGARRGTRLPTERIGSKP